MRLQQSKDELDQNTRIVQYSARFMHLPDDRYHRNTSQEWAICLLLFDGQVEQFLTMDALRTSRWALVCLVALFFAGIASATAGVQMPHAQAGLSPYLATGGDDHGLSPATKPFATLDGVRTAIRRRRKKGLPAGGELPLRRNYLSDTASTPSNGKVTRNVEPRPN